MGIAYSMKILYSNLKKKDVIDLCSGKRLGRIRDLEFTFPDGRVTGFVAVDGVCGNPTPISFSLVERIGKDAVLIKTRSDALSPCDVHNHCDKPSLCDKPSPCNNHNPCGDGGEGRGKGGRGGAERGRRSFFDDEE